jgi:hypothetical protein
MLVTMVVLGVGPGDIGAGGWRCLDLLSDACCWDSEGGILGGLVQVATGVLVGY